MVTAEGSIHVAFIGAGNGGLALAGYAGLHGARVSLSDRRDEPLAAVRAQGGIRVSGGFEGLAPVVVATTDVAAAIEGARLIVVVVPAPEQQEVAAAMAPHLRPGQVVLLKPGCVGCALEVAAALRERGASEGIVVAETDTFVINCRLLGPGTTAIRSVKRTFGVAALPGNQTAGALAVVRQVLPNAVAAPSVLHTSLSYVGSVMHIAPMLTNAGLIERTGGSFEFYGEGITPAVARVMAACDAERLAVAGALGLAPLAIREWIQAAYGLPVADSPLYEAFQRLHQEVFKSSKAPAALTHHYLTQDVACGAVPLASLGEVLGVPTPVHDAFITMAGVLCGTDFASSGRTVARMGLGGLGAAEIRAAVGI